MRQSQRGSMDDEIVKDSMISYLAGQMPNEWKEVGRCLGFNDAELTHMRSDHFRLKDAIHEMLLKWKQRNGSRATCLVLAKGLDDAKRLDLAQELTGFNSSQSSVERELAYKMYERVDRRTADSIPSHQMETDIARTRESPLLGDKANVFVQCLQKKYRRLLSLLKPIPWERQLKKKIEDTFQNVGITWLEGGKDGKYKENWKFLDSYEAIFTYDGLAVADRIVIEGDPGCGKTTLMYQLARLWCNNKPPMTSVHIFILLLMKHIKPGMSIYTAIRTTLLPRDTYLTDEDIRLILEAKSSKILALDGLDEYSGRNSEGFEDSDFMASLKGEMLLDIKEIVTTRSSCLSDLDECSVERIRIEGFTEDSWTAYLRNAFSGDEGTARGVFESITRHDILETLCSIPLFFMLICHITKDDIRLGRKPKLTTVTEVFKHIITCMRAHYDNKNIDTIPKVESEGELIEELAFCGLLSTSLQLTWSKEHIATSAEYDVLVTCGILVEEDGDVNVGNSVFDIDMRPKAVRFRHMLFQEWHGATYFSRLLKNSEDKFIEKIKEVNSDDLHYLLRFTCGLNPQATNLILEHLLKMQKLDTFCMCFIEHTQDHTSLKEVVAKMCRKVLRLSWSQGAVVHRGYASLLQFATEQKIAVRHISIEPQALKRFALEKMILTSGVQLKPLVTVKSLAFEVWPDEKAFPWLERCENLDTLAIYTFNEDVDPTLLWDIFGKTKTKVYYSTKDSSYILRYKQWMNKHDFIRCDKCGEEHINGYRFRCKTCKYFNLCETCKESEKHDDRHIFYKFDGSETVHRYIECSCCGEEHIRGSRFRCETCKYFNLCIICKDKGKHKEHKFKEYDGNEPQHVGINCSICEEDSIRGDRHRCKSCEYFNLCDVCKLKGVHAEHEFRRFDGTEPIYDFIKCDGCGEHSIRGYRYRCVTCKFYNLCGSCKNNGKHREHNFRKFDGTEVRHNFKPCDGCGEDEIRGVRHRCKTCENFNLCEWCMSRVLHEKHEFEKFDGTQHTHTYVKCNGCGEKSIVGNRYRCKVCKNFNLCESCKGRKVHTQHEFHQYDGKEHMHSFIRCNGCGERNIRGNRYRCTTCEYFNLCEWCEKRGEHNHHTLQRFDGKETSHGASCDRCGEKHIKGDRFRCKSCTNVNLCRMCKENGNHGYHEFQKIERNKYTHDFINCNRCGEHNINGVRYRCKTCVFYNLCSWCKNKGIHSEHDFRIFNGTEAKYDYVKCNGCGEKSIIGDRYRCNQCDFFNLCECCKENGIHKEHDFYKFDEFEHTHGYIGCDCCGEIEIRGDRFKCTVCDYFNLCRWCKNKGVHAEHEFEKYDGSEHKHVMIKCDGCNEKHIRGDRYRCLTCKYFNLCAWCKQKGRHKEHDFRKFDGSECIQGQVKCDGCLETSIRGDRYRCNLCIYYNLCSQCMDRNEHRAHEFTRLDGTEHKHDFIACRGCGEVDIRGDRYRCKICKYYNLCEWCKERGEHDEHEFQRFNGSEPKHDFIKCTFCGERSIIGKRYRCTSCRNVNQCELCKEKDLHPEHEYKRYDGHEHVHVFINCDGCGEVDIRGDRYRCKTCDYYNLCEQCHSAGVHDEHKFGKFDGKENRHDCIKCDGCGEKHIRSLRYRCKTCKYFNLCEWCKDRGKHKEHHFQTFDGYEFKHNRKSCGRCGERHIRGIRYRCKTLDSYNLCQLCMESSEHKSVKFQRYDGKEPIHEFITCKGCGERHIVGDRYRCKECRYLNLCELCFRQGKHTQHEFHKFDGTEHIHVYVQCGGCGELNIRGTRYRCKTCAYFNLCALCRTRGVHMEHEFKVYHGDEPQHDFVRCEICREMHIKGYRYRCTKCIFYNLCGWCMSRGEHKEHKFMRYDGREVQHDYIRCDGCGERNIKGDRYRCTICTYFNLCGFCKARGTHTEHTFHIFSGHEPQHNFVKCDGCGEEHIRGNRYRCKTCVYFNLCEWCKNKGKHTEHGFQRFNGSEPLHDFIRCVGCSEKVIRGDRFRCKSCMYINLCTFCKTRGVHNHHDLEKYTGSEFVHYFIDCNSCGEKHIRGDRYRCKTCLSVNICKCCYLKRIHNKHAFTIFCGQEIINHFINCSNCGEIHIRGMRYKCKTCCGFNLCQRCKESGTHKEHELQKFDGNEFVHKHIRCAICGEKHIRGDRYRCKICLYFNLCKCCKENGKHPGHELHIFDGSEFVHSSVVCDNCEEAPMIGKRFKCQTCGNYDLCQCCKEKGVHPDHKFKEISGREYVHKNIQCNGCGERHIKGDRYRCKSCVYFNICKTCRENGEHPEHEFEIFDGSEIAHYFVRCNSCEEGPIIGVRFKCDLCEDYNLCSCCKNKQVHQDHTFKEIATGDEGVEYLMSALSE